MEVLKRIAKELFIKYFSRHSGRKGHNDRAPFVLENERFPLTQIIKRAQPSYKLNINNAHSNMWLNITVSSLLLTLVMEKSSRRRKQHGKVCSHLDLGIAS